MTNKLTKSIEVAAGIAIITAAILPGVVPVKHRLLTGTQARHTTSTGVYSRTPPCRSFHNPADESLADFIQPIFKA